MVDGGFTLASSTAIPTGIDGTLIGAYFPSAKIGNGNYVYVWSGGVGGVYAASNTLNAGQATDNKNYFGVSVINGVYNRGFDSDQGMTVAQANAIDKKMDDGLPQSGNVQAFYLDQWKIYNGFVTWSIGGASGLNDNASGWGSGDYDPTTYGAVVS